MGVLLLEHRSCLYGFQDLNLSLNQLDEWLVTSNTNNTHLEVISYSTWHFFIIEAVILITMLKN